MTFIVLAAAAGFMLSGVLPLGAQATGTPTLTLAASGAAPTASLPPTRTGTAAPVVLLGRTGVLQFQDKNAVVDQAALIAAALLAPPPGSQYEVWLVEGDQRRSLGILTLDGNGRGELTSTDEQGQNLIAQYSGMEVTIEPDPDSDPSSSGIVAYSFTHAQEGLTHLRYLLAAYPNTPSQNALIHGLYTNIATVDELAREMQRASANGNQERLLLNAEAILNLVVGKESASHKDWNNDGQADDPSDGYGLLQDHSRDCVARCEAAAREQYGVSNEDLLRIVYGDLERHARQQSWPQRVYYFLDEPRPEYGNVQPCAELIKIRTRACPDTLFSGYYSTGAGRDVYFETMPVSIAHVVQRALELVAKGRKQIWDYDGNRVRHDIGRWAFVAARVGLKGFCATATCTSARCPTSTSATTKRPGPSSIRRGAVSATPWAGSVPRRASTITATC